MHYVSAQFDRIRNIDSFLPQNLWKECHRCLSRVVSALDAERDIKLGALKTDDMAATAVLQKAMSRKEIVQALVYLTECNQKHSKRFETLPHAS